MRLDYVRESDEVAGIVQLSAFPPSATVIRIASRPEISISLTLL